MSNVFIKVSNVHFSISIWKQGLNLRFGTQTFESNNYNVLSMAKMFHPPNHHEFKLFHSLVRKWHILPSFPWKVCSARVNILTIVTCVLNLEHHLVHVYICTKPFGCWVILQVGLSKTIIVPFSYVSPKNVRYIVTIPHYVNLCHSVIEFITSLWLVLWTLWRGCKKNLSSALEHTLFSKSTNGWILSMICMCLLMA